MSQTLHAAADRCTPCLHQQVATEVWMAGLDGIMHCINAMNAPLKVHVPGMLRMRL